MRSIVRWLLYGIIHIAVTAALLFLLFQQWWVATAFLAVFLAAAAVDLRLERRRRATETASVPVRRIGRIASLAYLGIIGGLAIMAAVTMFSIAW